MTTTLTACDVLADWYEENYNESIATWVRGGMNSCWVIPPSDFVQSVREGGMLPLLVDALEEVSVPVPTVRHPQRPDYFTVEGPGYGVVRSEGRLMAMHFSPKGPYSDEIVKGPFERPSHAYFWLLVLKHQS